MVSGSTPSAACFFARPSRRFFDPHVIAYWLTSDRMARQAASFQSSGAGKSGKPWARLIARRWFASRVISRMTLSVKRAAFAETNDRVMREFPVPSIRLPVGLRGWERGTGNGKPLLALRLHGQVF